MEGLKPMSSDDEVQAKRRRKARAWMRDEAYDDETKAQSFVDAEDTWSISSVKESGKGTKKFYRCRSGTFRKNECPAAIYLLFHKDSRKVTLYRADVDHVHVESAKPGLPKATRKAIEQLLSEGHSNPTAIVACLQKKGIEEPKRQQLYNYLARVRKANGRSAATCTIIHASMVKLWCEARTIVPDDPDKPFVVAFNVCAADTAKETGEDLKIFMSTRRLLEAMRMSSLVQIDTHHKMNWQGYSVFIVGTTDADRTFHPYGLAVCYSEAREDFHFIFSALRQFCKVGLDIECQLCYLLANSASEITKGFEAAFQRVFVRLTCWTHVLRRVKEEVRSLKKEVSADILKDIVVLHECESELAFNRASDLFVSKWAKNPVCSEFLKKFQEQWLQKNNLWYKAASDHHPSSNDTLEAATNAIKAREILRTGLPVEEFLSVLEKCILPEWSYARSPGSPNCQIFSMVPTIPVKLWTLAHQLLVKRAYLMQFLEKGDVTSYYLPSDKEMLKGREPSKAFINTALAKYGLWETFEEYVFYRQKMWTVKCSGCDWTTYECCCPVYLETRVCVHTVSTAYHLGQLEVPEEVVGILQGQKRKRCLPTSGKSAIIRE